MSNDTWEVLENAGMDTEREVAKFETYPEAVKYMKKTYSILEIEKLQVDITRNRSTEY